VFLNATIGIQQVLNGVVMRGYSRSFPMSEFVVVGADNRPTITLNNANFEPDADGYIQVTGQMSSWAHDLAIEKGLTTIRAATGTAPVAPVAFTYAHAGILAGGTLHRPNAEGNFSFRVNPTSANAVALSDDYEEINATSSLNVASVPIIAVDGVWADGGVLVSEAEYVLYDSWIDGVIMRTNVAMVNGRFPVIPGSGLQFSAYVVDRLGNPLATTGFEWILLANPATGITLQDGMLNIAENVPVGRTMSVIAQWTLPGTNIRLSAYAQAIVVEAPQAPIIEVTGVNVTPATPNVNRGATQIFTAALVGTNPNLATPTGVTWSIQGNMCDMTNISPTGVLTVSLVERATQITVTATSNANRAASGTATANILAGNAVLAVMVNPSNVEMLAGASRDFTAEVIATGTANRAITWSVVGNTCPNTRINGNGRLAVSINEAAESFSVIATSVGNLTIQGEAIVTLHTRGVAEAIAEAESRVRENYTGASWTRMQTALRTAVSINNNANATPAQRAAVANNLWNALDALEPIAPSDTRLALREVVAEADIRMQGEYSALALGRLEAALRTARIVYNNPAATQVQIDTVTTNLRNMIDALV
jgi:hypothetical protein